MGVDGNLNTVSIYRATLAPSAKFAERKVVHSLDEPVNKRDIRVDKGAEQSNAKEFLDTPHEYAAHPIVCHVGKDDKVRYIMPWNAYAPAEDRV